MNEQQPAGDRVPYFALEPGDRFRIPAVNGASVIEWRPEVYTFKRMLLASDVVTVWHVEPGHWGKHELDVHGTTRIAHGVLRVGRATDDSAAED
ncbi:hypothetical protein ABT095_15220 [Kitasatospora sp. NPDC002227]|uniref:hypothetical protein n=1 Tax=Kitasatospora sp. NPDC002227 TaxID=3154773 RepID=UPI00333146BC